MDACEPKFAATLILQAALDAPPEATPVLIEVVSRATRALAVQPLQQLEVDFRRMNYRKLTVQLM